MTMSSASHLELDRIEAALRSGRALTPAELTFWADRVAMLRHNDVDRSGTVERRNALIRDCARRFFPQYSAAEQARRIAAGLTGYRASAWRRDRCKTACPPRLRGYPREFYWAILVLIDRPIAPRTIRRIVDCGHDGVDVANRPVDARGE
jgi:hypothetical protein